MSSVTNLNGTRRHRIAIPAGPHAGPDPAAEPAAPSAATINATVEKLARSFEAFKAENDKRLEQLAAGGSADVVTSEHVDRINASVGELQAEMTAIGDQLQAVLTRPTETDGGETAAAKANSAAFSRWVRGKLSDDGYQATVKPDAIRAAGSTDSDPDGGFLVPDATDGGISRIQGVRSVMRQLATVRSIGTQTYKVMKSLGGATSGWVGERDARSETNTPQISEISIATHEIYAEPHATQTLLDDASRDIAGWYAEEVGVAFDEQEGDAFINGNGVDKPAGFLGAQYTKIANASWAWGKLGFVVSGHASTINDSDELIDLVYALKPAYRQNASWLMNDLTTAAIRKLKDGDGNYIWAPSLVAGEPAIMLGYPQRSDDNMPDQGANAFPLGFADWARFYTVVDRMGVRVLRDPYTAKPYVKFYTTKRVGGGVEDFQAGKLMKCST